MPSVFLSYRHENDAHSQRVRDLALCLRKEGLEVVLDVLMNEEKWRMGGPPDGWLTWSYAQVEANDRVLIIATPSYSQVYENKAPHGVGLGAAIEARRIFTQIAHTKGINEKFRVVALKEGDEVGVPDQLKDYHIFKPNKMPEHFKNLVIWLKGEVRIFTAAISNTSFSAVCGFPDNRVSIDRDGFVNCDSAFTFFENMLTSQRRQRILLLKGHGNQGKSTLLAILFHHCRNLLGDRSIARVEFKRGGPTPDEHVRAIARALGVQGTITGDIDECVHRLLDACRDRPAIILFDAYEHAEFQHQHWVNIILERTLEDLLLRCVVAGREIPLSASQPWGKYSSVLECDALKDKDAIIKYAIDKGFKGKPAEVAAFVSGFVRLRERAVIKGNHDHNISSQALLEEIRAICSSGGEIA